MSFCFSDKSYFLAKNELHLYRYTTVLMSLNVLMALFLEERSNVRISTLQDELEANGYMKHINYGK